MKNSKAFAPKNKETRMESKLTKSETNAVLPLIQFNGNISDNSKNMIYYHATEDVKEESINET